ncbi:GNAT family acetyltransferase [Aerococcus urinaehominis]|uniref:GNAT family acetyltransferase n=1 Tax=Aerococcus urinaehominis TaxID=128944 RepID=A0A109RH27_9LACT|nr:GNAT family N-acetyltransferase [Aerococcus urinaehominis]AMB99986.1 GNAT family acetyltransferase [Aerococcus urinaehominis]SDL82936.1 Ribosomal protein S18 acetylase RimI [Aerococcus urinaehominis]
MKITNYQAQDIDQLTAIWNTILSDGMAFPGEDLYDSQSFADYLADQDVVNVMRDGQEIVGYYLIHPNNIGRCSHVANASYCMNPAFRGQGHFRQLVAHSLATARNLGYRGMQYNAVVSNNYAALRTYTQLGFTIVGTIPGGFRIKDGTYVDMYILYLDL